MFFYEFVDQSKTYLYLLTNLILGCALYRYQTLYYPYGVALRAQRYESWGRYLR